MRNLQRRSVLKSSAAAVTAAALPKWSMAQTASYGAQDLKGSVLTPFGSLRAGNADGSIPAWTGDLLPLPAGFDSSKTPEIFTDEKPLYSITGANASQYQEKLAAGALALLQKYPDFRMDVYPSHRTAVAPQYVYDYIYKNATTAQLSPTGGSVMNAYGGIPFPFPKNGSEHIWNHLLAWEGTTTYFTSDAHTITATGEVVLESRVHSWFQYPYYFENGEGRFNGFYLEQFIVPIAPPFQAGGNILFLQPVNPEITPPEAWEYLLGERRTRRAPELQYDTPNSLTGGTSNWDEANIFSGKLDRYDFKYLETKEMIVPYNSNKFCNASIADQFNTHFVNPDLVRWELHRVRIIEATLKPGARNVDNRRIIYCDDDTTSALMGDIYDASGSLWKFQHNMAVLYPNIPCLNTIQNFQVYELHAGDYSSGDQYNAECTPQWKPVPELPSSFMTAGQLAATAGGF